jgi:O-antigen ligase
MIVRIAAVIFIALAVVMEPAKDWQAVRIPALIVAMAIALVVLQLVPLPPALWTLLPGRETAEKVSMVTGAPLPWRPLSLTPDLSLNTLLSLLPPAAAVVGMASIDRGERFRLLPVLLIGGAASAIVGLVQLTSGDFYLYRITNPGYPVGFFANRNHQASLIAILLPMLAIYARHKGQDERANRFRPALAVVSGIALLPFVLANGSRAGLGLALAGLIAALALYFSGTKSLASLKRSRVGLVAFSVGVILAVSLTVGAAFYARNDAFTRIATTNNAEDQRFKFIPEMTRMAADFFPFGSGFGSFDAIFRSYEPSDALTRAYFNHAHNDALELAIEASVPGFVLLTVFLGWWAGRARHHWRDLPRDSRARQFGRLGCVVIGILLAASLVDYPVRTPLLATIFFIAACWTQTEPTAQQQRDGA